MMQNPNSNNDANELLSGCIQAFINCYTGPVSLRIQNRMYDGTVDERILFLHVNIYDPC